MNTTTQTEKLNEKLNAEALGMTVEQYRENSIEVSRIGRGLPANFGDNEEDMDEAHATGHAK